MMTIEMVASDLNKYYHALDRYGCMGIDPHTSRALPKLPKKPQFVDLTMSSNL